MSITSAGRPLRVAHIIRDGGGTAPVELTVAAKLRDRGHRVTLYGPPEVRAHAHDAGFGLNPLDWPPGLPESLIPRMTGASAAWARRLAPRLGAGTDLVVADCTAFGALMAARLAGVPSAAVMPTVYLLGARTYTSAGLGDQAAVVAGVNRARGALGLPPVASLAEQILDADRLLVLTARAFEPPDVRPPDHARYVGPQPPRTPQDPPGFRPPEGDGPLVLVSLSTSDQGQLGLLERLLAALGGLPVRALVTLGPSVPAGRLRPPANAVLERYVPHAAVLPYADLVVTHAGHGTVLTAVSAGVPLVCVPIGRDQPAVAARVERHGLGVRADPDAGVADLRTAIRHALDEPAYRAAARRMARAIEPPDRVVDEIEALAATPTGDADDRPIS